MKNVKLEKLFSFLLSDDEVMVKMFKKLYPNVSKTNKDIIECSMNIFNSFVQRDVAGRLVLQEKHDGKPDWNTQCSYSESTNYYKKNESFYLLFDQWDQWYGTYPRICSQGFIHFTNKSKLDLTLLKEWIDDLTAHKLDCTLYNMSNLTKSYTLLV